MQEPIVIAGAGSIGCFIGGLLATGGRQVTFLARPRIVDELGQHGLHLGSFEGWSERVDPAALRLESDAAKALSGAGTVLVTVKSGQTTDVGRLIARHAPPDATVISLQNGLRNADQLRDILPGRAVFAAMVSFNILHRGEGRFHRGTSGPLVVDARAPHFAIPHVAVEQHERMPEVMAGKLVYNLNNALNALSGLPLRQQLGHRSWRKLLAAAQEEALAVFRAAGIRPWSLGAVPIRHFPAILRLPDPLFRLVASAALRIDAEARSSMWEDLEQGRPTEIGELQGEVVEMGVRTGIATPVNAAILTAVRDAERQGPGSPGLGPEQIAGISPS